MICKIITKEKPFTQIDNSLLRNKKLSHKARGIASYLLSFSPGHEVRMNGLVTEKDGIDSIRSGMKELAKLGYAKLVSVTGQGGKFKGKEWQFSEEPIFLNDTPKVEKTTEIGVFPTSGFSDDGKTPTINNININIYSQVLSFLNKKTGSKYRPTTKSYQRLINARVNEGATIEDFEKVILQKCDNWLNDASMRKYLRPETLFGTKFQSYLNEAIINEQQIATRKEDIEDSAEQYTEENPDYEKYLTWLTTHTPDLLATVNYLSRRQFEKYQSGEYHDRSGRLSPSIQKRKLVKAHELFHIGDSKAAKYASVWDLFIHLIDAKIKQAETI